MTPVLMARDLAARYGRREVFHGLSLQVAGSRSLGVLGPNGAGKTTLLRVLAGLRTPSQGEVRIRGLEPRDAVGRTPVAYFAGETTLPGAVRASAWSALATTDPITPEHRPIRTLSRGARQVLGLRTVLGRHPLALILLDEPWEGLDPDAARWLSTTIEAKRDKGAAIILASHYFQDLAGVCDAYLFLVGSPPTLLQAHEISPVGPVTAALLIDVYDKLRGGPATHRLVRGTRTA
ncbi:MAG: ATP-binding cassette domain-containing protein [Acidobacteria bacterium]|nr:ATP-binding cassette domain-containing protein [Acidobacteriota bacterium]